MKIQLKKSNKEVSVPWHQDFRNPESLPDIKVIRTQFFLNVVAIVLPLIIGLLWVQQELTLGALRGDIAKLEEEKATLEPANVELVGLSRDFMKESAKIEALQGYYYNLFPVSDYLMVFSESVPGDMVISSLELNKGNRVKGNEVTRMWESKIAGYVSHGNQEAINIVNSFVEEIGKEALLDSFLEQAVLDSLSRDQATDTLNFAVSIAMSDTGKILDKAKK